MSFFLNAMVNLLLGVDTLPGVRDSPEIQGSGKEPGPGLDRTGLDSVCILMAAFGFYSRHQAVS